ncbi:hypothetical protein BDK92_5559 [Micromonospora pisi]|uniref:Uncharacterized protein n=1 Tax=Micromonospora pisi TaxID=589240 RepID=A0A495JRM9_9ACTN|nr:hypothetical protein [Micromonospora pisi]RKR91168.1 hypothetical protein BDK92_5559 [Micromonospora pisi]
MRGDDEKRKSTRQAQERVGRGEYGSPDEVTLPTDGEHEARQEDWQDPADARTDTGVFRDGGPTRTPRGMVTTTGGTAGPASVRRTGPPRGKGKVAPTTTGDATTGGMSTPVGGSTSDQSGDASQAGR